MTVRPKLEVAWDVDVPSLGFAERVVGRATAMDDALEAAARSSRIGLKLAAPGSSPSADGKRYRLLAVAVAAAAAVVLFVGALPVRDGDQPRFEARHRSSERVGDDRSLANGGNPAINPEAGTNGVW